MDHLNYLLLYTIEATKTINSKTNSYKMIILFFDIIHDC